MMLTATPVSIFVMVNQGTAPAMVKDNHEIPSSWGSGMSANVELICFLNRNEEDNVRADISCGRQCSGNRQPGGTCEHTSSIKKDIPPLGTKSFKVFTMHSD